MTVIKTFPPAIAPDGEPGWWLDIVRQGPGQYDVQLAGSDQVVAEGFYLPSHAEEWVVEIQARQRGWVRMS